MKHEYDIDAIAILDEMRTLFSNHSWTSELQKELMINKIDRDKETLMNNISEKDSDLILLKDMESHILSPKSELYPNYLALKIITMDSYKIEAMLSYQMVNSTESKSYNAEDYLVLVEYRVYQIVKDHAYLKVGKCLNKIMKWLNNNRKFILDDHNRGVVKMVNDIFALDLVKNLKPFFSEEDHQFLIRLLVNGEELKKLRFIGNKNQLPEFFRRLLARKELIVNDKKILANWIVRNFVTIQKNDESGELSFSSVWKILKSKKNSVKKDNRILLRKYKLAPIL